MRTLIALFIALAGFGQAHAQDEDFYIFLCFGQSNMEGYPGIPDEEKGPVDPRFQFLAAIDFPELERARGNWYPANPPLCRPIAGMSPADYFGRALVAELPESKKVGVINIAVPGSRIELFDETTKEEYLSTAPDWLHEFANLYDKAPYQRIIEMGKLAKKAGIIKGILLHQGESNTGEEDWPDKVKVIYENILRDLGLEAENVPLIAGELVAADQGGKCASMNPIIRSLPETIPTAHVVSSEGCPDRGDDLHFSTEGYKILGRRYADTMLPLLQK